MYVEKIKYTDYDGNEREEPVMFELSEAEVVEMDLITPGGMNQLLQRIIDAKDMPSLITEFKNILLKSYGVKSPDGRHFIKTPEKVQEFVSSPIYSMMFMKMATDEEYASNFIKRVLPQQKNNPIPAPATQSH